MDAPSLQSMFSTTTSSKQFNSRWIRDALQRIGRMTFCLPYSASLRDSLAMLLPLRTIIAVVAGVVAPGTGHMAAFAPPESGDRGRAGFLTGVRSRLAQ